MSIVTELRRLPGCVRVFFDSGEEIRIPSPLFRQFRVQVGEAIDPERWRQAWSDQSYASAMERAAALLSVRDATEQETAQRLLQSGYPEKTVARVMETLTQAGYVDDSRYAGHFVESRAQRYGSRRLYAELRRKGVSEEVARDALSERSDEDESDSARRIAGKLLARKNVSDPDVLRRAVQQLVRRGFSWDAAKAAVEAVSGNEADE